MQTPLTGILPVAPTPFFDDGALDPDGMRRVLDCMIDQGVDAICILANYSEQFLLSDQERDTLMRLSLEHVAGRVPVIVTISHFHTGIAVDRGKAAQALGASMVMMMPPYHGVGLVPPESGIFEHFQAVSDALEIPIMVQDAPLSGCSLPVPLLARMARELEQVSYFKMEMPFAAELAALNAGGVLGPLMARRPRLSSRAWCPGRQTIRCATVRPRLSLRIWMQGATGTMTSALQPEKIRPIVTSYLAGNHASALAQWQHCLPLINHENRQCGLRASKVVMKEGGVIRSDHVRHPLRPMSERTRQRLLSLANDMDLLALKWGR